MNWSFWKLAYYTLLVTTLAGINFQSRYFFDDCESLYPQNHSSSAIRKSLILRNSTLEVTREILIKNTGKWAVLAILGRYLTRFSPTTLLDNLSALIPAKLLVQWHSQKFILVFTKVCTRESWPWRSRKFIPAKVLYQWSIRHRGAGSWKPCGVNIFTYSSDLNLWVEMVWPSIIKFQVPKCHHSCE